MIHTFSYRITEGVMTNITLERICDINEFNLSTSNIGAKMVMSKGIYNYLQFRGGTNLYIVSIDFDNKFKTRKLDLYNYNYYYKIFLTFMRNNSINKILN